MLPAKSTCHLLHGIRTVGWHNSSKETHSQPDRLMVTGAMASTYKLSIIMTHCRAYPHHVKEIIDSEDGNVKAVPLAGAVGDSEVDRYPLYSMDTC